MKSVKKWDLKNSSTNIIAIFENIQIKIINCNTALTDDLIATKQNFNRK